VTRGMAEMSEKFKVLGEQSVIGDLRIISP
jgi:hypothetical protein